MNFKLHLNLMWLFVCVSVCVLRSWSHLRRKPSTSMEGWTRVGPSLLPAQPNLQRNDEEDRREEEMQRMMEGEMIVRDCLLLAFHYTKQVEATLCRGGNGRNATVLKRHAQNLSFICKVHFSSYLPLNCCHALLFFLSASFSLHLCNIFQRCHSVAYRSVFCFCLFVLSPCIFLTTEWQLV